MDQAEKPAEPVNLWDGNDLSPAKPWKVFGDWMFNLHGGEVDAPTPTGPSRQPEVRDNSPDAPWPNPIADWFKGMYDDKRPVPEMIKVHAPPTAEDQALQKGIEQRWVDNVTKEHGLGPQKPLWNTGGR